MRAWPNPDVPLLPGSGPAPAVHDSSTGSVGVTEPAGAARMYVCGITPYDATHIGHANTYVAFDLLNRAWRDAGLEVRYVQNVTARPLALSQRCTMSDAMVDLAWPMWHSSYGVMPHTYIRTWPGVIGENSSRARVSVL